MAGAAAITAFAGTGIIVLTAGRDNNHARQ